MQQQQVPLFSRVVLLHAAVIGCILAIMQITTNLTALGSGPIQLHGPARLEKTQEVQAPPARVRITRLTIDVPVTAGQYDTATQTWSVGSDKAQYIAGTSPNVTVIYGHNTPAVFELTNSLQVGDTLMITSKSGETKTYRYTGDHLTTPQDTSDLYRSYSKPTVALLTCNGFWSQDRRFMFFELEGK